MANTTLTFTLEGRDRLSKVLDDAGRSAGKFADRLALFSAAIPAAAALAPLAVQAGAAGAAVAAFGVAVIPQITALGEASKAQKKFEDAVEKTGAASAGAVKAENEYLRQLSKLPPASQQAAVALSQLKDEYTDWSDALASDTMPVFTQGLAVAGALLPRLTPLVKGASGELSRFMAIIGGSLSTPGLDGAFAKFDAFAVGALRNANNGLIHFARVLNTGQVGKGYAEFMDYARQSGPVLAETLRSIGAALVNVLQASAGMGLSVLQLAGAFARVVASLPTGFITTLMQAAVAIRAVRLATSGIQLAAGAFIAVRTAITAMGTAAIGASGMVNTLRVSFMALSLSARLAVAASGIGLLVLAMIKLSSIGKQAPPDVDRLTTSLTKLGTSGKVTGEAARAFGSDLKGLGEALRTLSRPSNMDKTQQFLTRLIHMDSTPVKEAKQAFSALDDALTSLVKGGHPERASAALELVTASLKKQGFTSKEINGHLDKYKSALADAALEQELTARSMGLFGAQAQQVQAQLDAQKQSTDGLRQSIIALNDVNRQGISSEIAFEDAISKTAEAAKKNAGALSMSGGELNLTTEKGRVAATALNDLAQKTDEAAASARQGGKSWEYVNGIYSRGRDKLIEYARQMGLNKDQAAALADQILKTPDKTARLRGNLEDLQEKLSAARSKLASVPDSRTSAIRAQISQLESAVAEARRKLDALDGKTVSTFIVTHTSNVGNVAHEGGGYARGGLVGFPGGGPVRGPGTSTSDSIIARLSNREFVMNAKAVAEYGLDFMTAVNNGQLGKASVPASAGRPVIGQRAVIAARSDAPVVINVSGALDPIATAKQIQKLLVGLKRVGGVNISLGV
ncbi:hypothetical protein [Streptomyces sp. NPDC023838]|uniref:hypothetical protein n=1 Tax=Streptomyces sp. NPDC023838 TaxID=3154325 RepID=UPI0033EF52DF